VPVNPAPTTAAAQQQFRSVFGHFATGVAVITGQGEDGPAGMTTNALCSLSLEPLLVLVCFDREARTLPIVRSAGRFGVNVLAGGHHPLAGAFASKAPHEEKFAATEYELRDGVPVLNDALAWLACELRETHPGGDHVIAIGEVVSMGEREGEPLIWYRGGYTTVSDGS
jgi:3-hydroxy-9,10-secoandrosta-1,3,5(10)-triene-9,17-dione monooxygenase reductase component